MMLPTPANMSCSKSVSQIGLSGMDFNLAFFPVNCLTVSFTKTMEGFGHGLMLFSFS